MTLELAPVTIRALSIPCGFDLVHYKNWFKFRPYDGTRLRVAVWRSGFHCDELDLFQRVLCVVVTGLSFSSRRVVSASAVVEELYFMPLRIQHHRILQTLCALFQRIWWSPLLSMASKKKDLASENEESSVSAPRCSDSESSDTEEELEEPSSTFHRRVSTNRTLKNSVSRWRDFSI